MILVLALMLLAIVSTPLFALLALTSVTGFLETLSGEGWVAPVLDALGRRGLNSPELAAAPLLLLLGQVSCTAPSARATRANGQSIATLAMASLFVGVVQEVPLRSFAWALVVPASAVVLGTTLVRRSLWRPHWEPVVCAALFGGFLAGWLWLREAAALCVLVAWSACALKAEAPHPTRLARRVVVASVQAGALCVVMVAWLGVQALWEQMPLMVALREQAASGESYRLGVCVVLSVELLRVLWPTLEHSAAAYLGERYGAPMDRATRAQLVIVALVLAACAAWPDATAWLPRMAA